jgi:hypothetical protein
MQAILAGLGQAAPYLTSGGRNISNASNSSSSSNLSFAPVINVQTGGGPANLSPSASGSASSSGAASSVPDYLSPGGGYGGTGLQDIYDIDDQADPPPVDTGEIIPGIPDMVLLIGGAGLAWYLMQGGS